MNKPTSGSKLRRSKSRPYRLTPSAAFTIPAVLIYTLLFAVPLVLAYVSSLTNWNGLTLNFDKLKFIGIDNFSRMLKDRDVLSSIKVSLLIMVIVTLFSNGGGLYLANILSKNGRGTNAIRSVFFIPYVLSSVSIAFIWMAILSYNGLLNNILTKLNFEKLSLFQNTGSSLLCIIIVEIWRTIGFYMVLYIAALKGVPTELVEAATLDGTSERQLFWKVKFPLIFPQFITGILMSITTELRLYDMVLILTGGGPGSSTRTIAYTVVEEGFNNWRMGYAGAIACFLSVLIIIISFIFRTIQRKTEVDL